MSSSDHSQPSPSQVSEDVPHRAFKRKKANISRACTYCRRRRTRCDGQPRCATCIRFDQECLYDPDSDGRKPASKAYVAALVNRIKTLEDQLARPVDHDAKHDIQHSLTATTISSGSRPGHLRRVTGSGALGALRVDNESLSHHGPTSAYMHLPEPIPNAVHHSKVKDERGQVQADVAESSTNAIKRDISQSPWDMYLPTNHGISWSVHQELLSIYFSYLATWCWWMDEDAFKIGLVETIDAAAFDKNENYSPLMHNVLLALAVYLSPDEMMNECERDSLSSRLFANAVTYIEKENYKPTVSYVKGLMMLGTYSWCIGKHSMGWIYEGMGVRMAQTLGLNTDCTNMVTAGTMQADIKALRDRCFYTVYLQDQLWCLAIGRAAGMSTEDFETNIPAIEPEVDALPWLNHKDARAFREGRLSEEKLEPSWKSSAFHHTCQLAVLADKMHDGLYRIRSRYDDDTKRNLVSELHLELNTWLLELPSPLRIEGKRGGTVPPHIINMHAVFRYLQILLHRPTYTKPHGNEGSDYKLAVETCNLAATEIDSLIQLYSESPGLHFSTTTISNVTFASGSVHLMAAVQSYTKQNKRPEAILKTKACIANLRAMRWKAAKTGAEILQNMLDEWIPSTHSGLSSRSSVVVEDQVKPSLSEIDAMDLDEKNLSDPQSRLGRMLTSLGWQPPPTPTAGGDTPLASLSESLIPFDNEGSDMQTASPMDLEPNQAEFSQSWDQWVSLFSTDHEIFNWT